MSSPSESPSTQRHAPQRRSRWTTWIVLLGTLAVGAVLLVTMRALFEVGSDMSRSVREAAPPARGRARGERARPIESTAPRDVLEQAEPALAEQRVAVEGEHLHGRIVLPEGTPADEVAWVELSIPAARPPIAERARAAADGAFVFTRTTLPAGAVVTLDARYLDLAEPVLVEPGEETRAIELRPVLGTRIVGHCVVPAEHAALRAWIVGCAIEVPHRWGSWWGEPFRAGRVDAELGFELRALTPSGPELALRPSVPFLEERFLPAGELRPGVTLEVELRASPGARMSGRVTDEAGSPLAGALLAFDPPESEAWNTGLGRDETGADGRFAFLGLRAGAFTLRVRREGFLDLVQELEVQALDENRADLELRLATVRSISGRVFWPDGTPAAGASIAADPEVGHSATMRIALADDEGAFEFGDVGAGRFLVSARASIPSDVDDAGHVIAGRRGVAFASSVAGGTEELELRLGDGITLRGRVADESGAPCTAFEVRASPVRGGEVIGLPAREVQTAFHTEDGRFEIAGFHPGTWEVRAAFGNFRSAPEWVDVRAAGASVELVLEKKPVLSGRVLDEEGNPARGVRVWYERIGDGAHEVAAWMEGKTETDDVGRFEFTRLEPGRIVLQAGNWKGPRARPREIEVPRRGRVENLELVLQSPARLVCTVVDEAGAPVSGARVDLVSFVRGGSGLRDYELLADERGRVERGEIEPARYVIVVRAKGRMEVQRELDLPCKEASSLRVVLARGARLVVRYPGTDAEREVLQVTVLDTSGKEINLSSDPDAVVEEDAVLAGLAPLGEYRVVLRSEDGREATRAVTLSTFDGVSVVVGFDR